MPDGIWGFVQDRVRRCAAAAALRRPRRDLQLAPASTGAAAGDAGAGGPRPGQAFRRPQGGGRRRASVRRGGVHALIGPNGSGKTTTLNVLSGLYVATAGRVVLGGRDITRLPPHARTAAGPRPHLPEHPPVPLDDARWRTSSSAPSSPATASQGATMRRWSSARARRWPSWGSKRARTSSSPSFSYGHQRLIEIARALAGNPSAAAARRAGGRPQLHREDGAARPAAAHRAPRA